MMSGVDPPLVRIAAAGDAALVAQYPARIDPVVNTHASALAGALRARWSSVLRDVVVGFCSVTAYFDPLSVDARWLEAEMLDIASNTDATAAEPGAVIQVPVRYGGEAGPDLENVAAYARCSPDEVIALHAGPDYRVYMVGFVPGFPYLAEVDPRIAVPRRATPRPLVPAGSVGIAGGQTGIYPSATPGGWNIIGRTSIQPYDLSRSQPCLFRPGDRVRFVPLGAAEPVVQE
jgi:inhibitor of KinA